MNSQSDKYMELQQLEQQLKQLQQQTEAFEQQLQELTKLHETVDDLGKVTKDSTMLAQVGNGVFVDAEVKKADSVVMTVGAGVAVRKTIPDAKTTVEKQMEDVRTVILKSQEHTRSLMQRFQELQKEFMAMQQEKAAKTEKNS